MKTEKERLEENTRHAYAMQKTEEFVEYLHTLVDTAKEAHRWSLRGAAMVLFVILVHFTYLFLLGMLLEIPPEIHQSGSDLIFIVFLVVVYRSLHLDIEWKYADGKLDGALEMLKKLGLAHGDDDDGDQIRKRVKYRSPFKRFKELFERVGSKKTEEAYA